MKNLIVLLLVGLSAQLSAQEFSINPEASIQVEKPNYDHCLAQVKNQSKDDVVVSVRDFKSGERISSFGLARRGKDKVYLPPNGLLFIQNEAKTKAKVKIDFEKTSEPAPMNAPVTFTLKNTSAKSIPLVIPGVMNPNLSPFSKSGVILEKGQEIYYKKNGVRKLLLIVDDSINEDDIIDIPKLILQIEQSK